MQTLIVTQLNNKALLNEFILNCRHQVATYVARNSLKERTQIDKTARVLLCLTMIVENFNSDFQQSPFDFFYNNFDKNRAEFLEYLNNRYKESGRRKQLIEAFNFIVNDILPYHNTRHWIPLEQDLFPKYENPADRFLLCMNLIVDVHYPTQRKFNFVQGKKYKLIAHKINEFCNANYMTESIVTHCFHRNRVPEFTDVESEPEFFVGRRFKPKIVLEAIEKLSLAPPGYLTSVIPIKTVFDTDTLTKNGNLKNSNRNQGYRGILDMDLITDHFRNELYTYCGYKTEPLTDKRRNENWVVRKNHSYDENIQYETILDSKTPNGLRIYDPRVHVPSFSKLINGLIVLIKEAKQLNIISNEKLTFFHLTQPKIVKKIFSKILKEKGRVSYGETVIVQSISAAWNPEHCFFYEYSDEIFCERYNLTKEEIFDLACKNYEELSKLSRDLKAYVKPCENSSKVKNRKIIQLDVPASYILDMLSASKKDIEIYKTHTNHEMVRVSHLNAIRDTAIVMCLMQIPLRVRNWADMMIGYHPSNECIYKDKDHRYIVSVPKHCFKNFHQKIIPDTFVLKLSKETSKYIDLYLNEVRPVFLRGQSSDFFIVSSHGNKLNSTTLGHSIRLFTARYGNQNVKTGGIGIHYFRDIVATTFLKKNKGAFAYVAYLLLDSEKMVREHYGHLSPDDAFGDWNNYLDSMNEKGEEI